MVMVLEQEMINRIAHIGRATSPNEACGLLLPTPINGVQVIQLPNRSLEPQDSVEMRGEDMLLALEQIFQDDFPEELIPGLTVWHTHPGGNVGPSRFDLENKPAHMKSLVVTLFKDKRAPLATWY